MKIAIHKPNKNKKLVQLRPSDNTYNRLSAIAKQKDVSIQVVINAVLDKVIDEVEA